MFVGRRRRNVDLTSSSRNLNLQITNTVCESYTSRNLRAFRWNRFNRGKLCQCPKWSEITAGHIHEFIKASRVVTKYHRRVVVNLLSLLPHTRLQNLATTGLMPRLWSIHPLPCDLMLTQVVEKRLCTNRVNLITCVKSARDSKTIIVYRNVAYSYFSVRGPLGFISCSFHLVLL